MPTLVFGARRKVGRCGPDARQHRGRGVGLGEVNGVSRIARVAVQPATVAQQVVPGDEPGVGQLWKRRTSDYLHQPQLLKFTMQQRQVTLLQLGRQKAFYQQLLPGRPDANSTKNRRKMAGWDDEYLRAVLAKMAPL